MELLFLLAIISLLVFFSHIMGQRVNPPVIHKPCPPAPHKWSFVLELDQYGIYNQRTRCEVCKKYAGEIQ